MLESVHIADLGTGTAGEVMWEEDGIGGGEPSALGYEKELAQEMEAGSRHTFFYPPQNGRYTTAFINTGKHRTNIINILLYLKKSTGIRVPLSIGKSTYRTMKAL